MPYLVGMVKDRGDLPHAWGNLLISLGAQVLRWTWQVVIRTGAKAIKALICKIYNLAFLAALKSENNLEQSLNPH